MMDAGLAIEVAVKGVVVLAAACTMYFLMRRYAASQRHLVLAVAMVGVLMIPLFSIGLPNVTMPIRATAIEPIASVAAIPSTITSPSPQHLIESGSGIARRLAAPKAIVQPESATASTFSWMSVIAVVWAAGFVASLSPFVIGLLGIRAVRRSGRPLTDPEWTGALRAARVGLGLTTHVTLIESRRARVPMTWGIFRSMIALPESAQDWSPQRRQVVLCHELAHIKRRDFLTQAIARVACAAHWFNPLSWWALRAMSLERERACDDLVVESGVHAPDYADHLLQIVRDMKGASLTARTAIAMAGHSRLEQRVRALLDATQNRRTLGFGARIATAGCALACVALVAMLQPTAVAEEASSDEDTKVVIRVSDDDGEKHKKRKRVRRNERVHTDGGRFTEEQIESFHAHDGDHDISTIIEHVSEVLEDVDLEVIIEKAMRSLEREDVQGHIERALEHVEDADIHEHIQRALEQEDVQGHIERALEHIEDVDIHEHIQRALEQEDVQGHVERALEHIEVIDIHEHVLRALEQEDVQGHIERALEHIEDIDIQEHIQAEIEKFDSSELSPEDIEEIKNLDRRELRREIRRAKHELRNVDIGEHLDEALSHLEDIDIGAHIEIALDHISELQDSPEMHESMESVHEALEEIDFDEIGNIVIETLSELDLDIEPIIDVALHTIEEIDVDAIIDTLNEKIEEIEVVVDTPSEIAPSSDGSSQAQVEILLEQDNLRRANLSRANLSGLDLSGKNLRSARLAGADLRGANLEGADLRDADLTDANLREANLQNAKLSGALLDSTNLRDADLTGVTLSKVELRGADLRGAKISTKH